MLLQLQILVLISNIVIRGENILSPKIFKGGDIMFDFEINDLMRKYNYNIPSDKYLEICNSPQITEIKYSPYGDCFEISTKDGGYWKFGVYKN